MYQYKVKLVRVVDGDTVDVDIDLGFGVILSNQRIRLANIDAPESRTTDLQEKKYGLISKQFLQSLLPNQFTIKTIEFNRGKYGRIIADIYIKDISEISICVNDIMISLGHAVPYIDDKEQRKRNLVEARKIVDKNARKII